MFNFGFKVVGKVRVRFNFRFSFRVLLRWLIDLMLKLGLGLLVFLGWGFRLALGFNYVYWFFLWRGHKELIKLVKVCITGQGNLFGLCTIGKPELQLMVQCYECCVLCSRRQPSSNVEKSVTVFSWNRFILSNIHSPVLDFREEKPRTDPTVAVSILVSPV